MKLLKPRHKKLNKKDFSNILERVSCAKETLLKTQRDLSRDSLNNELNLEEKATLDDFVKVSLAKEFLLGKNLMFNGLRKVIGTHLFSSNISIVVGTLIKSP